MKETTMNTYYWCGKGKKPVIFKLYQTAEHYKQLHPSCVYFGRVFEYVERNLKIKNLTFYITWNTSSLPSYGQNVVAIVLGDEWCRIPLYFDKVRAIFKCYGTHHTLGCNPFKNPSYQNLMSIMQFQKAWMYRLPSRLNYRLKKIINLPKKGENFPAIYDIPLGYYKQLDLPIKDITLRENDLFFAGSLAQKKYSVFSFKYWFKEPKTLSRMKMINNLEKIQGKHSNIKCDLYLTSGFHATNNFTEKSYSEKMMNTKICLVPRGTSLETFRFFEAMRYGCVAITETLPSRWYYDEAPHICLKNWDDLEEIIEKLIGDQQLLQAKHQESLKWWQEKCSEKTVGEYIAIKLNETFNIQGLS